MELSETGRGGIVAAAGVPESGRARRRSVRLDLEVERQIGRAEEGALRLAFRKRAHVVEGAAARTHRLDREVVHVAEVDLLRRTVEEVQDAVRVHDGAPARVAADAQPE